jgi:hypothetical protein
MVKLVLLSIDRSTFMLHHNHGNDLAVSAAIVQLWSPYAETDLECFTCGQSAPFPPFSMVLPEYDPRYAANKLIVAPLCDQCRDIKPPALRFSRCITILKKMAKARGHPVAFHQLKHNQPHPT